MSLCEHLPYKIVQVTSVSKLLMYNTKYAELNILCKSWPDVPTMVLTGSVNKDAIADIKHNLVMLNLVCLAQSFNHPNLHYLVCKKPSLKKDLMQNIASFIKINHPNDTSIIFALSRVKSKEMVQKLREEWGMEARHSVTEFTPLQDILYIFLSPNKQTHLSLKDFLESPDHFCNLSTFIPNTLFP